MIKYIVQIKMKDGSKKYVSLKTGVRPSLIVSKSQASTFNYEAEADVFSNWFWENHWDDDLMDTRSTERIKKE